MFELKPRRFTDEEAVLLRSSPPPTEQNQRDEVEDVEAAEANKQLQHILETQFREDEAIRRAADRKVAEEMTKLLRPTSLSSSALDETGSSPQRRVGGRRKTSPPHEQDAMDPITPTESASPPAVLEGVLPEHMFPAEVRQNMEQRRAEALAARKRRSHKQSKKELEDARVLKLIEKTSPAQFMMQSPSPVPSIMTPGGAASPINAQHPHHLELSSARFTPSGHSSPRNIASNVLLQSSGGSQTARSLTTPSSFTQNVPQPPPSRGGKRREVHPELSQHRSASNARHSSVTPSRNMKTGVVSPIPKALQLSTPTVVVNAGGLIASSPTSGSTSRQPNGDATGQRSPSQPQSLAVPNAPPGVDKHYEMPTLSAVCRTPSRFLVTSPSAAYGKGVRATTSRQTRGASIVSGSNVSTAFANNRRSTAAAAAPPSSYEDPHTTTPCSHWDAFKAMRHDSSRFASIARWAELAFEEATLAAKKTHTNQAAGLSSHYDSTREEPTNANYVGDDAVEPPSVEERDLLGFEDGPSKLMTSVSCMILDTIMKTLPGYEQLWPQLRTQIFGAIFTGGASVDWEEGLQKFAEDDPQYIFDDAKKKDGTAEESELTTPIMGKQGRNSSSWASGPRKARHARNSLIQKDEFRMEFGKAKTYYEKCIELSDTLRKARVVIAENRGMADKFAVISDMTNSHIQRRTLSMMFHAWRLAIFKQRNTSESIDHYATRQKNNNAVTLSFLRWRRYTLLMRWRKTNSKLEETVDSTNVKISDLRMELADLQSNYTADTKALQFELFQEKEIQKNMLEGHAVEINEMQDINDAKDAALLVLQKETRRWQRVAKTLRPVEDMTGPFSQLLEEGESLRQIEELLILGEVTQVAKARAQLEKFLVTWVNCELAASGSKIEPISNTMIDLRDGEVFIALARILRPPHEPKPRGEQDVFTSLVQLMYINTNEGLFPPLILHCPFYKKFFTAERFLQGAHPTACLWVLASLFIARAVRTPMPMFKSSKTLRSQGGLGNGPGPNGMPQVKLPTELLLLQGLNLAVHKHRMDELAEKQQREGGGTGDTHTKQSSPVQPTPHRKSLRQKSIVSPTRKNSTKYPNSKDRSLRRGSSKAGSGGLNGSHDGHCGDKVEFRIASQYEDNDSDNEAYFGHLPESSEDCLPSLPPALQELDLQGFVEFLTNNFENRKQWNGLARVVSAVILRHRILDVESAAHRKGKSAIKAAAAMLLSVGNESREGDLDGFSGSGGDALEYAEDSVTPPQNSLPPVKFAEPERSALSSSSANPTIGGGSSTKKSSSVSFGGSTHHHSVDRGGGSLNMRQPSLPGQRRR